MLVDLTVDRSSRTALYLQIAEQIKDQIGGGKLPDGTRLPTVRRLAQQVGVTRLTVQNAYGELQSGGWVEATVGRGTFVSRLDGQTAPPLTFGEEQSLDATIGDMIQVDQAIGVRSMALASPDPKLFPVDEWWQTMASLKEDAHALFGYTSSQGYPTLRVQIGELLRDRGLNAGPDSVMVTAGATQALSLVTQALARPGETVAVEQPTYLGFLNTVKAHGVRPLAVPMDDEGPELGGLERLIVQQRPRFFYTVPNFQNPTGICMSPTRRRDLLALSERHGLLIVEDDLYGAMAYDGLPPTPLKAIDEQGLVVYVSGFSKTLMPSLRLGYVIAPMPLHERLLSLRRAADLCSPSLLQQSMSAFLANGGYKHHLRRVIPIYRERRDALLTSLQRFMPASVKWTEPQGGFCAWLTLPPQQAYADIQRAALQLGWAFAPGASFMAQPALGNYLRLCFGNQSPGAIRSGVKVLGDLVRAGAHQASTEKSPGHDWEPLV